MHVYKHLSVRLELDQTLFGILDQQLWFSFTTNPINFYINRLTRRLLELLLDYTIFFQQ